MVVVELVALCPVVEPTKTDPEVHPIHYMFMHSHHHEPFHLPLIMLLQPSMPNSIPMLIPVALVDRP